MRTTNKFIRTALMLFVTSLVFTSCSPEDGKDGEQGPIGNANVIVSDWLSFQQATYDTTRDGSNLKENYIDVPELNSEIMDKGAILVYIKFLSNAFPLPYTSNAGGKPNTVSFIPDIQKIYITRFAHDNSGSLGFGTVQFKYILIPKPENTGMRLKGENSQNLFKIGGDWYTLEELKAMSYEEICDMFNISE